MTSNQPKRQLSIKSKTPTVSRPWGFIVPTWNSLTFSATLSITCLQIRFKLYIAYSLIFYATEIR
nr:MAG TPA: hypothetical protein [Caudoviricetes sp.]